MRMNSNQAVIGRESDLSRPLFVLESDRARVHYVSNSRRERARGSTVQINGESSGRRQGSRGVLARTTVAIASLIVWSSPPSSFAQCEVAKLTNPDDPPGDLFCGGAIEGDVVVTRDSRADGLLGALYVFRRNGMAWDFEAKLTAPERDDQDSYGGSVAMSGKVIVVGAPQRDAPQVNQGAVFVYRWQHDSWEFEAELVASNGEDGDLFGNSVGLDGNTLVVGAPHANRASEREAGAAYMFEYDGARWNEVAELTHPEPMEAANFGQSVAIGQDVVAVAAPRFDSSVVLFRRVDGKWTVEAILTVEDAQRFGDSLSVASGVVLVGSWDSNENGIQAGAAWVFRYLQGEWAQEAKLLASDGAACDFFGDDVGLTPSGTVALIGSPGDDPRGSRSGSVYVFRYVSGQWEEQAKIIGSCSGPSLGIGNCLDADEDLAVLGQPGQPPSRGTVYIIAGLSGSDCNGTGQSDSCDIFEGESQDDDGNGVPDECERADVDGDGDVDMSDLLLLLANWGPCELPCDAECAPDLNRDCVVDVTDLRILLLNWT